MPKHVIEFPQPVGMVASPDLQTAPVLDLMCSHFVLTLATKQGSRFNPRRDWSASRI